MILNALRHGRGNNEDQARAQARVDAIVTAARAATVEAPRRPVYRAPEQLPLVPSTDPVDIRIEEELAHTRRMIESLGDELSNDPILLMRHQQALQRVDLMAQTLGHLACVIGAADRAEAISRIGMASLKTRLGRATQTDAPRLTGHAPGTSPLA